LLLRAQFPNISDTTHGKAVFQRHWVKLVVLSW
jgi:hypothetical protein